MQDKYQKTTNKIIRLIASNSLLILVIVLSFYLGMSYYAKKPYGLGMYQDRFLRFSLAIAFDEEVVPGEASRYFSLFCKREIDTITKKQFYYDTSRGNSRPYDTYNLDRMDLFVKLHKYLIYSVGYYWRLTGVSLSGLKYYFGFFFCMMITGCFLVIKMLTNKYYAFVVAIILSLVGYNLAYFYNFRDFSKAPFFAIIFGIIFGIIKRNKLDSITLLLFAVLGALTSIGSGFRKDLNSVILIVPFVVIFMSGWDLRKILKKLFALAIFACVFAVCFLPLNDKHYNDTDSHSFLLGQIRTFTQFLDISPSFYDFGYVSRDTYISTVINYFAQVNHDDKYNKAAYNLENIVYPEYRNNFSSYRIPSRLPIRVYYNSDYHEYGTEYLIHLLKTFPADFLMRTFAATLHAPRIAFWHATRNQYPTLFKSDGYKVHSYINITKRYIGYFITTMGLIAVVLFSARAPRMGLFLIVFWYYAGGIPFAQYHPRHTFHLELIGWLLLGLFVQEVYHLIRKIINNKKRDEKLIGYFKNAAIISVSLLALTVGTLQIARAWQVHNLTKLFTEMVDAKRDSLKVSDVKYDGNLIHYSTPYQAQGLSGFYKGNRAIADYLCVIVKENYSKDALMKVRIDYDGSRGSFLFDREFMLEVGPDKDGETYIFTPVYLDFNFRGVTIDKQFEGNLVGIYRLPEREKFKLQLNVVLASDWQKMPLYEKYIW